MIPKMKKFLVTGSKDDLDQFFSRAQELGQMEFISISEKARAPTPQGVKEIFQALKILKKQPVVTKQEFASQYDAKTKVKDILFHNQEIERHHEQIRVLKAEIARLAPLGNFSSEEIRHLAESSHKTVQFFVGRHNRIKEEEFPESVIYINSEFDLDYFMYVGNEPYNNPLLTELVVNQSAIELKKELDRVTKNSHMLEDELRKLATYMESIQEALTKEMNRIHLQQAKDLVDYEFEGHLFFVQAWIPENKLPTIIPLLEGLAIICDEVAIEDDDTVPTYMENKGFSAVGQDLVNIYDTPSTSDRDPSPWVIWAFALFFAMIIADAGYGMLYLITAIVLWVKFPEWTGSLHRFKKLLTILATFSVIWGVLVGSYFSVKITPDNPVNKVSLLYHLAIDKVEYHKAANDGVYKEWIEDYPGLVEANDAVDFFNKGVVIKDNRVQYKLLEGIYDNLLLEIAIIVGIVHLVLSMLRNVRRTYSGLGWAIFLVGGYLFVPGVLHTSSMINYIGLVSEQLAQNIGQQMLYIGGGLAIVLAIFQDRLKGIGEVFQVIQIFADTLSYLRLYALGMASMILAATFNELGEMVGLAFGFIIIILGHAVNIVIGIMGGVIHGLRLNFLEWYHYCFEGGGKAFRPLKLN